MPALWYFGTPETYPPPPPMISQSQISCNAPTFDIAAIFNICEILQYNRQLVVITHELIYGVRAAIR